MRRLLFFLSFLLSFAFAIFVSQQGRYRDVYRSICDLTEEHFYKDGSSLRRWVEACRSQAARVPLHLSAESLLQRIQDQMSELNVSHFSVYSPVEDRKLWKGESTDTGLRARYIEDHLIVYRVFTGSSADKSGLRIGDEIIALPGADQVTPYGAEHRSGLFKVRRAGKDLAFEVTPGPLNVDSSPTLKDVGGGQAVLTISSFRSEYFEAKPWRKLVENLPRYRHIVIDVRENAGGNFVAMLRALSSLECGGRVIGQLVQPRKAGLVKIAFDDITDDAYQLKELEVYHSIGLRTFPNYGCYSGRTTVLIDAETSSVAEIFADYGIA
jgi:C-terminal processing protease CtpA/Prc